MTVPTTTAPAVPPTDIALVFDQATNMADLARGDISKLLPTLPDNTSLWIHVDLVRAVHHLRAASVLIDRAADAIEAEAVK
ncbi:Uncharacterised protein [Mycolicibacterium fortuitum]|uniref:Uncharacterized protein n=1 Tax=Mycolicibacterium fortuitum TaxID=1766 RepID=A0A378V2U3_MYCFO|nr:Uncharacterised protein [Mycolicibacterium fortuitum]